MTEEILNNAKQEFQKIIDFLVKTFYEIQTGRANPAILENITVEAYGQKNVLKNLAGISVIESTKMLINPWDKNILADIEKAVQKFNNFSWGIKNDGVGIYISIPPMTGENREKTKKIIRQKAEESRISIRQTRKNIYENLKKMEKEGEISEDDLHRMEKELQNIIDQKNKKIDDMVKKKEKDISKI